MKFPVVLKSKGAVRPHCDSNEAKYHRGPQTISAYVKWLNNGISAAAVCFLILGMVIQSYSVFAQKDYRFSTDVQLMVAPEWACYLVSTASVLNDRRGCPAWDLHLIKPQNGYNSVYACMG